MPEGFAQAFPGLAQPKLDELVHISADRVNYDREREVLMLSGNVEIRQDPWWLKAEQVEVDLKTRQALAQGGVQVLQGQGEAARVLLAADQAVVDLSGNTGWMVAARLSVPWSGGEINLQGERIERLDEKTYRIEHGTMTPCQCPEGKTPDWEVEASRLTAETENRVSVASARIKIRGHTVFYVPYLSYPIGTQRKTGFLMPVLDLSSLDGFEATLPFFWAFHPSADLTLYPHYIADRGFESGAELRYDLGPPAKGEWRGYFIPDVEEKEYRWSGQVRHDSTYGRHLRLSADLNLVSDNEYPIDYDHDLGHRYDRWLESRVIGEAADRDAHLWAEFSRFDDLQGGDLRTSPFGPDIDETVVQRLPELRVNLLTRRLAGPLAADLSFRGEHYWRDDLELGRGQMADLYPRLLLAHRLFGALPFVASGGYHGVIYRPDPGFDRDLSAFGQPEAAGELSAVFERVYPGQPEGRRARHTVEPKFFAFYQGEPRGINDEFFPEADPRPEQGFAGFNLENRLFRKSNRPDSAAPAKEMTRVELTQVYDWVAKEFSDLRLEGSSGFGRGFRVHLDSYWGWDQGNWTRVETRLAYRDESRTEYYLGYRWDTGELKSPLFAFEPRSGRDLFGGLETPLGRRLRGSYRGHYSLEFERFISQALVFDYMGQQKCWGARLTLADRLRPDQPDQPHDYSASVTFQLEK